MERVFPPPAELIRRASPAAYVSFRTMIAPAYYMALYTCVHGYCTRSGPEDGRKTGKHLYGQELYRHLERYLAAHVAALAPVRPLRTDQPFNLRLTD